MRRGLDLERAARKSTMASSPPVGRCRSVRSHVDWARASSDVGQALQRLAGAHALVLQPASGEVLMANPFSAVPTAFVVSSAGRSWWGNCIWDGLGILAMLGADGSVATACPDCGEALTLSVRNGRVEGDPCLAHFAVPARSWWDDVVFT